MKTAKIFQKLWETFLHGLNGFSDDFMAEGRAQGEMLERDEQ